MGRNTALLLVVATLAIAAPILKVALVPPASGFDGYNYSSYREIADELRGGLQPGDHVPADISVYNLAGEKITLASLWKKVPLVLETGSLTCPIFHGNGPSMDDVFARFDQGTARLAHVALLYSREAHPGWLTNRQDDLNEKLNNARKLKGKGFSRGIWVDSLDGRLHKILGLEPNSVYVIHTDGTVVYKSAWNAPSELVSVLDRMITQGELPTADLSNDCDEPQQYYSTRDMAAYIGRIGVVGGPDALADFLLNGPISEDPNDPADTCEVQI